MKAFRSRGVSQDHFLAAYDDGIDLLACFGSAGTGKTFLSFYRALLDVFRGEKERLIIVRSAVETRPIGFLPGTLSEKQEVWEAPYASLSSEAMVYKEPWHTLKTLGYIEFYLTSFVRGITFKPNSIILVDEVQNMDYPEIFSVLTRAGEGSRVLLCGDSKSLQCDLHRKRNEVSCFEKLERLLEAMQAGTSEIVRFGPEDVVRSALVRNIILADEKLGH